MVIDGFVGVGDSGWPHPKIKSASDKLKIVNSGRFIAHSPYVCCVRLLCGIACCDKEKCVFCQAIHAAQDGSSCFFL